MNNTDISTTTGTNSAFTEISSENPLLHYDTGKDIQQTVETIFIGGVTTLLCVVGIPASVINCLVFCRQGLQDRMNLCLFSLALTDFFYLLCSFTMLSIKSFITRYDATLGEEYQVKISAALVGFVFSLRASSGVISTVIAVERCLCVVFPLSASTLIRTKTMGTLICSIVFLLISCGLVYPFTVVPTLYTTNENKKWVLVSTKFYDQFNILITVLKDIVLDLVVRFLSFVIVCVSTTITVHKLRAAASWRQQTTLSSGNISTQQAALTSMLIVVSIIYIVTSTPVVTWRIATMLLPSPYTTPSFYSTFMSVNVVVHTCPLINSCVHSFVYYFRSKRFCQVFKSMFCFQRPKAFDQKSVIL